MRHIPLKFLSIMEKSHVEETSAHWTPVIMAFTVCKQFEELLKVSNANTIQDKILTPGPPMASGHVPPAQVSNLCSDRENLTLTLTAGGNGRVSLI